jgi:elongation factor G
LIDKQFNVTRRIYVKEYTVDKIRNIGLVSHGSVGKTSLAEAMLYSAGETNRLGTIDDGTTVSDYSPDEIERKISISTSMLHLNWKNHKINMLDTPGYSDFIGEVIGALQVCDTAVILLNGVAGIEVGTETVYRLAEKKQIPRVFFVNRLDKEHADFNKVFEMTKDRFGNAVVALQFPVNEGEAFDSVVDVVRMKMLKFEKNKSGKFTEEPIPNNLANHAAELRNTLMETISENDEELLDIYCDVGELSDEQLRTGLRNQIVAGNIFPVICGTATANMGVYQLLDLIVNGCSSPADRPKPEGVKPGTSATVARDVSVDASLSALVFKTISEPHVGELSFFRVFSGVMKTGNEVLNSSKGSTEKIGQIYLMNGKNRKEIGQLNVGDIGAIVKLKDTSTGDTLCDKGNPIVLPEIKFPEPVIRIAVEPKAKGDEEKISSGLHTIQDEDPTFKVVVDPELKQIIIHGQGELHLDIIIKRLKEKYGVDVNTVEPKIPYRETIRGVAEGAHKYKKQSGGRGQYGDVSLKLEPLPRGEGYEFVDAIVGGVIPNKYIPAVEKGIKEAMAGGIMAGYPVIDVKVTLFYGSYHSVDSSDMAFKIAGSMCFKKVFKESKPVLLEPIYDVEVQVPEDFMGDVMGDISSRRGKILGMDAEGPFQVIKAKVPLAELYKYSTTLRSLTQGRGVHRRKFSHYEEVPKEIADKIIAQAEAEKEG